MTEEKLKDLLARLAIIVEVTHAVQGCRDPKDDKFLEVAFNGRADVIISIERIHNFLDSKLDPCLT